MRMQHYKTKAYKRIFEVLPKSFNNYFSHNHHYFHCKKICIPPLNVPVLIKEKIPCLFDHTHYCILNVLL